MSETTAIPSFPPGRSVGGFTVARNAVWNLIGLAAPLPIALVTIPLLTGSLGPDRFGVLALIWALVGYSGLFDLGLGRVVTKVTAQELAADRSHEVPALISTALLFLAAIGFAAAVLVVLLIPRLVDSVLKIPVPLQSEARQALTLLALFLPFLTTSSGLRGMLEAQQRFALVSAVSVTTGCFTLIGPALLLPYSHSLVALVAAILAGRLVAWVIYLLVCFRTLRRLQQAIRPHLQLLGPMLRFGGWLTVSNIIGPMLTYFDRFIVSSLLSVAAVGFYTVPYDLVSKTSILPSALGGVLFPAFAASYEQDRARSERLFGWGVKILIFMLVPLMLTLLVFAREGLQFWLGSEFALKSTPVLQWLAVGMLINGLAQIPFVLVQAAGRPDLTAKLHTSELVPYLISLWWLVRAFGITGAAMAWTARATVDTLILLWFARTLLPRSTTLILRVSLTVGAALLIGVLTSQANSLALRVLLLATTFIVFVPLAWFMLLAPEDHDLVKRLFSSLRWWKTSSRSADIRSTGAALDPAALVEQRDTVEVGS
jgi:O-antigen/teichoic acid export membrane protein